MAHHSTPIEDPFLEAELNDREAIIAIKELYDVNEETATELWQKFVDTVRKMKVVAEEKREAAGADS